jgi:hypothetical protein
MLDARCTGEVLLISSSIMYSVSCIKYLFDKTYVAHDTKTKNDGQAKNIHEP